MKTFNSRLVLVAYLVGIVIVHGAVFWRAREIVRKGYPDFTIYYGAATMVRQGFGHRLYDESAEYKVRREFAPDVAIRTGVLPYNHPPFEALGFVPFTYISYSRAFVFWDLLNVSMLLVLPVLLRPCFPQLQDCSWPLWILTSLAFLPVFFALLQGQDSILLLFLYTLAYLCLRTSREALAGGWLALGLFKPHLTLPFVLLLLVQGRRRILWGFLPLAAGLVLISYAVVGWEGLVSYPYYVWHLEEAMARGAIVPSNMVNLRGVLYLLLRGSPYFSVAAIAISAVVLLWTAWLCGKNLTVGLLDLRFALTVVATVIVSYHCLGYDLSVLILPIAVVASQLRDKVALRGWPRAALVLALGILFFSPLQLFLLMRSNRLALLGWAVLLLMAGISAQIWTRLRTPSAAQTV